MKGGVCLKAYGFQKPAQFPRVRVCGLRNQRRAKTTYSRNQYVAKEEGQHTDDEWFEEYSISKCLRGTKKRIG